MPAPRVPDERVDEDAEGEPRGPGPYAGRVTVLILGGTAEARALASALVAAGFPTVSSLAGRTSDPALPAGAVRTGGFGGPEGLARWLRAHPVTAVVDATHPFAATMTAHAAAACTAAGVPLLRLERPSWRAHPDAPGWRWVADHDAAAAAASGLDDRLLLTVGRQPLARYARLADRPVLARVAEAPDDPLPPAWTLLVDRGPFTLGAERALLATHGVRVVVTKDAGGVHTAAKLDAAREAGAVVVVVARPLPPAGLASVADVPAAVGWVTASIRPPRG